MIFITRAMLGSIASGVSGGANRTEDEKRLLKRANRNKKDE